MKAQDEPANRQVRKQPTFVVLNVNGENPNSRSVIREIRELGYLALVLKSLDDANERIRPETKVVSVYDTDGVVGDLFFIRHKEDSKNPSWAIELSTGLCVGICRDGIYPRDGGAISRRIKTTARDIISWFAPNDAALDRITRVETRKEKEPYRRPRPMMRT